jgi:hypothetical protein
VKEEVPQLVKTLLPKVERNQDLYQRFVDAQEMQDQNKTEEAQKLLQDFLSFPLPYEFQAFYGLRKQAEEALKEINAKVNESEFDQLLKKADTFVRMGQLNQARQICMTILEQHPDHAIAKKKLQEIDGMLNINEINTDELLQQIEMADQPKTQPPIAVSETVVAQEPAIAPSIAPPVPVAPPVAPRPSVKIIPPAPKPPLKPSKPAQVEPSFGLSPFMKWGLGAAGGLAVLAVLLLLFWSPTDVKKVDLPPEKPVDHQPEKKNPGPVIPVAQPLSVSIDVRPWAEVNITGKNLTEPLRSVTPARLSLPPGEYSVICTNPDFSAFTQTIRVSENNRMFRFQFQQLDPNQIVDSLLR